MNKKAVLFIPGGPGISGAYWDYYILSEFIPVSKKINIFRYVLPNHETSYSNSVKYQFEDVTSNLLDLIINYTNLYETYIVAHSFGCQLILSELAKLKDIPSLQKIILVNCPTRTKFSNKFQSEKEALGINTPLEDDLSFEKYLSAIAPLYFNKPEDFRDIAFKKSYWLYNQTMPLNTQNDLNLILNQQSSQKLIQINSLKDILLEETDCRHLYPVLKDAEIEFISKGKHFPMLEAPELFSHSILKHIVL